jgi:cellulose synthase/poly-beta-1,6-N-acetylglucosamine synthase-like glycosyltransferase
MASQITFDQLSRAKAPAASMKVSIVLPVYNEIAFIEEVLLRVQAVELDKEILVIDDGSTDDTRQLLQEFAKFQSEGRCETTVQDERAILSLQNIRFLFQDRIVAKEQPCGAVLRPPAETPSCSPT